MCTFHYLEQRKALELFDLMATEVISSIADDLAEKTLVNESIISIGQELVTDVADDLSKTLGQKMMQNMIQEQTDIQYQKDLMAIGQVAERTCLNELISQFLLGVVAKRGEDLVLRQYEDVILYQMLTDR